MEAKQTPPPPFKGLFSYEDTADDVRLFFGRDTEQEIVRANLMSFRLTVFYGPTGVGKSSILNAGVVHPLREQSKQHLNEKGLPDFCVVVFRNWRDDPASELVECVRNTLEKELGKSLDKLAAELGIRPDELLSPDDSLTATLKKLTKQLGIDLLIILDQFEEYFVYHPQENDAGAFNVEFARAVNDRSLRVSFLISIREEWVAKLDRFKGSIPFIFENNLRLKHLDRAAASAAISGPMQVYRQLLASDGQKVGISHEVAQEVLDDLQQYGGDGGPGNASLGEGLHEAASRPAGSLIQAPYLQLLMQELWEEQRMRDGSHLLQRETFKELGGVDGVRRNYVVKKMEQLSRAEQDSAAGIFRFLVTSSGTKYAQPLSNLALWADTDAAALAPVLDKLSGKDFNLLRRTDLRDSADPRYEVVHDMLAPAIHEWASEHNLHLKLARLRREEKQREKTKRFRLGFIITAVMCLALGVTAIYALGKKREADEQRNQAIEQRSAADAEKREADKLRVEESTQRALAVTRLAEADRLQKEAQTAKDDALEQKWIADEQRKIAEGRETEARAAEEREKRQRTRAVRAEAVASLRAEAEGLSRAGLSEIRLGQLSHIKEALRLFEQAEARYAQLNDRLGQAASRANIGDVYATLGGIASLSLLYEFDEGEEDFGGRDRLTGEAASQILRLLINDLRGKLSKTQKEELAAVRAAAIKQYEDALKTYEMKVTREVAENRASVLKRLGDIYFFMSLDEGLSDKKKENEDKGVEYYEQAASDHSLAEEHSDRAQTLRVVAGFVSQRFRGQTDAGERAKTIKRVDELYSEASESYQKAGQPLKAATVLFALSKFYDALPKDEKGEYALTYALKAYEILAKDAKPTDAAIVATNIADIYRGRNRRDEALDYYKRALTAYLSADSAGEKNEEQAVSANILSSIVNNMLGVSEAEKQSTEQSFEEVLKESPQNKLTRARLLHIISQAYTEACTLKKELSTDCARIVKFLSLEREAWGSLKNSTEEAKTLFALSEAYDREKNKEAAVRALDEAFVRRRDIAPSPRLVDVPLDENVWSGAGLYEKLGEHRKAAEAYSILFEAYLKSSAGASYLDRRIIELMKRVAGNYLRLPDGTQAAEATFMSALAAAQRASDTSAKISVLRAAGDLHGQAKNFERALFYLKQERLLQVAQKGAIGALEVLQLLNKFYAEARKEAEGETYLKREVETALAGQDSLAEATARHALGDFYRVNGNREMAVKEYDLAGVAYRAANFSPFLEPKVVEELVKLYQKAPDEKKVAELVQELIKLHDKPGAERGVRDSLVELIEFFKKAGDEKQERSLIEELIKLLEKGGNSAQVNELKERLNKLSTLQP